MDREYAAAYADLYRRHWWWRAREEYLVNVLEAHLNERVPATILDVGCGGGLFFERLARFGEVYGVETDLSMRTGREVDRRIHWGTLESYAPGRRYNAILFLDVLEHVERPHDLLHTSLRLLANGGIVVVTVPAFGGLWTRHDDVNHHVKRYTKTSFSRVAEAAGLTGRLFRYFFHWGFFAKLAVRASERVRRRGAEPDIPRVPGGLTNKGLYSLSRTEQILKLDRILPFGSSLLYIGTAR